MVQLSLTTSKGNAGTRHFPFQGHLGLTPIRVDGIVRTRLDEDQKPIQAKSITVSVRAYEARSTRLGGNHTRLLVDYSQTLWKKPDGQAFADIGEFESTFKITLPKRVAGFSTANYQDYKTYWRVEAVLDHAPLASVGSRILKYFDLMLIRYDIPPPLPPPTPPSAAALTPSSSSTPTLSHVTTKPRAPVLHYNLSTPTYPIGPSDLLFTSLFVRPVDSAVSIRSASILVERRIDLHDLELSAPSGPQIALSTSLPERDDDNFAYRAPSHSTLTVDSTASTCTINSRTPLIPHSDSPTSTTPAPSSYPYLLPATPGDGSSNHKTLTTTVAAAEGSAFALDRETGVWNKTISLQWPAARSHSRWAMGETMRGSLGAVSFWMRVKVIVTSSSGTESIDLAPRELLVVLTNDTERRQALAVFSERVSTSSKGRTSTSQSNDKAGSPPPTPVPAAITTPVYTPPKSAGTTSTRGSSSHPPPTASPPPASPTSASSQPQASFGKVLSRSKKPRRPHTSAGPRDSVDVRVGGGVPVPVPLPVPANGYSTSGSSPGASSSKSLDGRGRSFSSTKRYSPDHDSCEGEVVDTAEPSPFRTLNTQFTGLNGVGGAAAMLRGGRPSTSSGKRPSREADADALLVHMDVGAGVHMDKVRTRTDAPAAPAEDKSELIRAWEEELVRIEKASRRSSNMLAFWRKRDKPKERIAT